MAGPRPPFRRLASNFAFLSAAELVCRATSVLVTLSLAKRLGPSGYGRIEFAFNVVFWLVLLVRDGCEVDRRPRARPAPAADPAAGQPRAGGQGAAGAGPVRGADRRWRLVTLERADRPGDPARSTA